MAVVFGISDVLYCQQEDLALSFETMTDPDGEATVTNALTPFEGIVTSASDLTTESSFEGRQPQYKSKLTLTLGCKPTLPPRPLCFVVASNDGPLYLLGSTSRPRPTVTLSKTIGKSGGDNVGWTLTVSITQPFPLREVFYK